MHATKPKPALRDLAAQLLTRARETGEDRSMSLSHGARIAYRVRPSTSSGQVRVWFSVARKGKDVGTTELVTFKAQCGVPAHARRIPAEGQREQVLAGEAWHQVCWMWEESTSGQEATEL